MEVFELGIPVVCPECRFHLPTMRIVGRDEPVLIHPNNHCSRSGRRYLVPTITLNEVENIRKLKARDVIPGWPRGRSTSASHPNPWFHHFRRRPRNIAEYEHWHEEIRFAAEREVNRLNDSYQRLSDMANQCGLRLAGYEKGMRVERDEARQELALLINGNKVATCPVGSPWLSDWIASCINKFKADNGFRIFNVRP